MALLLSSERRPVLGKASGVHADVKSIVVLVPCRVLLLPDVLKSCTVGRAFNVSQDTNIELRRYTHLHMSY